MESSINEVARLAGTTSRTLRHYDELGLLKPSRVGDNGYRYYDEASVVRLQRILLLRDLGLSLADIRRVIDGSKSDVEALRAHLRWLELEAERVQRQIASVTITIRKTENKEQLMIGEMLDGFEHTQYKDEVEHRWGADSYSAGDGWWRAKSAAEKEAFADAMTALQADFGAAHRAGESTSGTVAHALAKSHVDWLSGIPGTPSNASGATDEYLMGLAEMYVSDERFRRNYDKFGEGTAEFVAESLRQFVQARRAAASPSDERDRKI